MPVENGLTVNIDPFDIVFPESVIRIQTDRPYDQHSAEAAITLSGKHVNTKLNADRRVIALNSEAPMEAGNHELVIDEILDQQGKKIGGKRVIPFTVVDSVAKVPKDLSVKSFVRLQVEPLQTKRISPFKRTRKPYVEILKAINRETGAPVELAFDQEGKRVKPETIFDEILANRAKRFGIIHQTLFNQLQKAKDNERLPVAVWLVTPPEPLEKKKERGKTEAMTRTAIANRKRSEEVLKKMGEKFTHELNREIRRDPLAPVFYADLTPEQIRGMAKQKEVAGIFLYERGGIEDLDDSIAIAQSDDVHTLGFNGSNINVAVWENGPDVTTDLTITAFFDTSQTNTSQHSRHTHGIIRNRQAGQPNGHAPRCRLHSANDKDLDALRWAVETRGCTVISQSFHRDSEPEESTMSYDDLYKDYLALRWPYPTILQAAGNYWSTDPDNIDPPADEYVNHKGYNSLAVGNHNDDASSMSADSVFRNPSSPHGDRELPEISANGTGVTTVGLTMSGTSMAAPAAAGVTALIQQANSTLESWPEGCRAVLLAGATINIEDDTWWRDVSSNNDSSDGSGAVDALESLRITQNRRSRNAAATRRGWNVGTLRSADFGNNGESTFVYKITVPRSLLSPRVKVALAWDSKVDSFTLPFIDQVFISSKLTLDLDLHIYDSNGAIVGYSGSWDNSYEIAEFRALRGETYTIRIRRWSGTDDTWFGIAWTVRGISFITELDTVVNGNGR